MADRGPCVSLPDSNKYSGFLRLLEVCLNNNKGEVSDSELNLRGGGGRGHFDHPPEMNEGVP